MTRSRSATLIDCLERRQVRTEPTVRMPSSYHRTLNKVGFSIIGEIAPLPVEYGAAALIG